MYILFDGLLEYAFSILLDKCHFKLEDFTPPYLEVMISVKFSKGSVKHNILNF